MSITRRNLLHGIAAAGTVIAAGARSVKALAPNGLKQPLPGAPASGPTLLNRNENPTALPIKCRRSFVRLPRPAAGTHAANMMPCERCSPNSTK